MPKPRDPTTGRYTPEGGRRPRPKPIVTIDLAPFQARFRALQASEGLTAMELARRLGWSRISSPRRGRVPQADGRRAAQALGLVRHSGTTSKGRHYPPRLATRIRYDTAQLLAEALRMDVHDWDF